MKKSEILNRIVVEKQSLATNLAQQCECDVKINTAVKI